MIGQTKLYGELVKLATSDKFPRFAIIVGQKGSGKKTLIREFMNDWNNTRKSPMNLVILEDVKVDTIRQMITEAYKVPYHTMYVIPDADNMSPAAKNALLKVTEESPNNAYFIMTVQDENNVLATIKSRGTIFHMNYYTPEEIVQYAKCDNTSELDIISDVCEVPGDVDLIKKYDAEKFYGYVKSVVDNIAECSGSNAFKISDKVAIKDEEDKYELRLFWRTFEKICLDLMRTDPLKYAKGIRITSTYLQELNITGISKIAAIDAWILDIREAWC